jgi:hypothetical protein
MTTVSTIADFRDELDELLETKDDPERWYVVAGRHVGEYSIQTADKPDDYDEWHDELPPEERDATENVDGYYQIGTLGWSDDAFVEDLSFVAETGFSESHDVVDRRMVGLLLVHEDALSEEALEVAHGVEEVAER